MTEATIETHNEKENAWMRSLFSAAGQWSYARPGDLYSLWTKFETAGSGDERKDDIRVAFEIDRLENLVQLEIYKSQIALVQIMMPHQKHMLIPK